MGNGINRYITDKDPILRYESQTLTEEQKALVRENIGLVQQEQVQADWNQNDETAPDYIKNRTHYEKDNRKYLDIEWDGDINNCISFEKFEIAGDSAFYFCKVSEDVDAVDFNNLANYTLFYKTPTENGSYNITEYNLSDISSIQGNTLSDNNSNRIYVVKDETYVVPSVGTTLTKGIYFWKYDSGYNAELTSRLVSKEPISGEIEIKKLDEKFIPDTIARVSDLQVDSSINSHNTDSTAHSDIRELIDANSGKVHQVPTSAGNTNEEYRVLLSGSADDESHIEGTRKDSELTYNPSTGVLKVSAIDMGIGVIKTNSELSAFVLEFN